MDNIEQPLNETPQEQLTPQVTEAVVPNEVVPETTESTNEAVDFVPDDEDSSSSDNTTQAVDGDNKPLIQKLDESIYDTPSMFYDTPFYDPGHKEEIPNSISLPSTNHEKTLARFENAVTVDIAQTAKSRHWLNVIKEGDSTGLFINDYFAKAFKNKTSEWSQKVEIDGRRFGPILPTQRSDFGKTGGEKATIAVLSKLNLGKLALVPLWHTGIWVTFKPPGDGDLLELHRMVVDDKYRYGRETYGLAYSNSLSYQTDRIVDYALSNIYSTTLAGDYTVQQLKEIICVHDIHAIILGILIAHYPTGFDFERACTANPTTCNHTVRERVSLQKILVTDKSKLTQYQRNHMTDTKVGGKTLESLKRYREESIALKEKYVSINGVSGNSKLGLTLKVPTIAEHVRSGFNWIGDITAYVEGVLGTDDTDVEKRNNYITTRAKASAFRQYAHYVKRIEIHEDNETTGMLEDNNTQVIEDIESIENTLTSLSKDDVMLQSYLDEIHIYNNESIFSISGIPEYDCPACGEKQKAKNPYTGVVNTIPIHLINVFFSLLAKRVETIVKR